MAVPDIDPPYALLAELTHRCPLRCVYCSNPLELAKSEQELSTAAWLRVIDQAAELGVLQVHFSGGEPLVRDDVEQLVRRASDNGLYTNLITSGAGLTGHRAAALASAGLKSVQLSLQAADSLLSNTIAGRNSFTEKQVAAQYIRQSGLPLSMNVVLHKLNIDQLESIIDTCAAWGADRIELANVQFYNWALLNRDALLPTRDQLANAESIFRLKQQQLWKTVELMWIISDYYEKYPKPCMGGWGTLQLTVAPDGQVLPCPVASMISTLRFESVERRDLRWIWESSPAFNQYRGFGWMPEPCRSCDRRFEDFGGCRCQSFALTGSADRTDPVCHKSTDRHLVDSALGSGSGSVVKKVTYRQP